jgi:hypothetical protein
VLGLVVVLAIFSPARGEGVTTAGFEISLTADKAVYRGGEPISLTLGVSNQTGREIELRFSSGQRFDFVIRDARGNEIWRWSEGRMFAQALGAETIGPAQPQILYRAQFNGNLGPGSYRVEGTLVAKDPPLSAILTIQVQ